MTVLKEKAPLDQLYTYQQEAESLTAVLLDPFTGEKMSSHDAPTCVVEIPGMAEGLDYLRAHADIINVTLFASRHSDEVVHLPEELDPLLDAHDAYFLEGYGTLAERREIHRRAATEVLTPDDRQNYRSVPSPYTDRQLDAISGRGIPIFMPELPRDGSEQEAALLDYSTIMDEFWPLAFGEDQEMTIKLVIAVAGSNLIREWYMLANMGAQMRQHEAETGKAITEPLIWMGGGHEMSLAAKAAALGVQFNAIHSQYDVENGLAGASPFIQVVGQLAVDGALRVK